MALCVVVKLEDVERTLANPPAGYKLVAVCQHQGVDPVEQAKQKRKEEECPPDTIHFIRNWLQVYEWRELYYERNDVSLLPVCVPTQVGNTWVGMTNPDPQTLADALRVFCPSCDKQLADPGDYGVRDHRTHTCIDDVHGRGCGNKWRLDQVMFHNG